MRARKKDANHADVSDYLRGLGWSVLDLASHGVSVDLAVGRPGFAALVEIKSDPKITHRPAGELTIEEQKLKDNWDGPYVLAESPQDAAAQLLALWRGWAPCRLWKPGINCEACSGSGLGGQCMGRVG